MSSPEKCEGSMCHVLKATHFVSKIFMVRKSGSRLDVTRH